MYYRLFRIVTSAPPLTYQSNTPSDVQTDHTIGETQEFARAARRLESFRIVAPPPLPPTTATAPISSAPSSAPASARKTPPYGGAGRRR